MLRLSVIVIAKNEAQNIRRCLASVTWADEVIVLDSGSADETVALAKEFTPHVFCTDWQGYGVQKQRALARASGDWVLNLDADESVSAALRQVMVAMMLSNQFDACRVPIRMCFYGKQLRFSSSPTRHVRLFKRDGAHFSTDIVHEKIILPPSARIGQLKIPLLHHSFRDVSHAIDKMNRYSSYSAKIRLEEKHHSSTGRALLSACWMFFRCYVLQRGFVDGSPGFLFAVMNAQGAFFRSIKQVYPDRSREQLPSVVIQNKV